MVATTSILDGRDCDVHWPGRYGGNPGRQSGKYVRFPELAVARASPATVLEDGRTDLVVRDGSTVVRLKPGETRALAVGGDLTFAPALQA